MPNPLDPTRTAEQLLSGEPDGFAVEASQPNCTVCVHDLGNPANVLNNAQLAHSNIQQLGGGTRWVEWASSAPVTHAIVPDHTVRAFVAGEVTQAFDSASGRMGILVEPAATNLLLWSNDLTQAPWIASNLTAAKTAIGPDGVVGSASTLTATAGGATVLQALTSASAIRLTSVWLKRLTGGGAIQLTQDGGAAWATQLVTDRWSRVELRATSSSNPTIGLRLADNGDAVDCWGFQHEVGWVATSTIPTAAIAVTRPADQLVVATSSIPTGPACSLYIQALHRDQTVNSVYAQLDDGTEDAAVRLRLEGGSNLQFTVTDGGVSQANLNLGPAAMLARNQPTAAWQTNDVVATFDGLAVVSDTVATIPAGLTTLRLGADSSGGSMLNGFIFRMLVVPRHVGGDLRAWRYNLQA
jgi:hypothetical protein